MNWEEISKYVVGEMSQDERVAFELQMKQNPELNHAVKSSSRDLTAVDKLNSFEQEYNTNAAWNKVNRHIQHTRTPSVAGVPYKYAAAAILLLCLGALGFFIKSNPERTQVVYAKMDETGKIVRLPDSTKVVLNRGAQIEFPRTFKGKYRRVAFNGEAFFKVAHNPSKPFIITTPSAEVKVLGTSFNVNNTDDKTEVLVESGKVQLKDAAHHLSPIILVKGDLGTLQNDSLAKTVPPNRNTLSWKSKQMFFEKTPLSEVIQVVERTYGVRITLPPSLSDSLMLTSTFEKEPLPIILESIGKSFNLTFNIKGQKVQFILQP